MYFNAEYDKSKTKKSKDICCCLNSFVHQFFRFDTLQDGMSLVDIIAEELGLPRHALDEER